MTKEAHQQAYWRNLHVHRICDPTREECQKSLREIFSGTSTGEELRTLGVHCSGDGRISWLIGRRLVSTPNPGWPERVTVAFKRYQRWRDTKAGYRDENCLTLCEKCHQDFHQKKLRLMSGVLQEYFAAHPKDPISKVGPRIAALERLFVKLGVALRKGTVSKQALASWLKTAPESRFCEQVQAAEKLFFAGALIGASNSGVAL
jgi:hypothetical protein